VASLHKSVVRSHICDSRGRHAATRDIVLNVQNDKVEFNVLDEQGNIVSLPNDNFLLGNIYRLVFFRENYTAEWLPKHRYKASDTVIDSANHGQMVIRGGRSGSTPPKWNHAGGNSRDGAVTWVDQGLRQTPSEGALLVLDVHNAVIEIPKSHDSFKIHGDFLQLLDAPLRHSIRCEVDIQTDDEGRSAPRYKSFRVGLNNDTSPLSVDLVANKPNSGGLDAAIGGGLGVSYGRHNANNSNPLEDAIGFTMPVTVQNGDQPLVKLTSVKPTPTRDFYVFQFAIRFEPGDLSLAKYRQLCTFGRVPQGVTADEVELGFTLIQRADPSIISTDKLDGDLGTHSRWVLHFFGVHAKLAIEEWRGRRQDYHRALNIARGGQPVSFMPLIDASKAMGYWVMTFRAVDEATASDKDNQDLEFVPSDESKVPVDAIALFPQSLCFWQTADQNGQLDLDAILPQVGTHSGEKLICKLPVVRGFGTPNAKDDPAAPDLSNTDILNQIAGVALSLRQAILVSMVQRVRMGALDAEFATADSNPDSQNVTYWMGLRREPPPLIAGISPTLLDNSQTPDGVSAFSDVVFALSDILPGGQDDPAGEEYVPERINDRTSVISSKVPAKYSVPHERDEILIEAHFRRKRPVMIARSDARLGTNYYLRVREDLIPSNSPALRLSIISRTTNPTLPSAEPCSTNTSNSHVVVLDRDPFLVAQVRYPDFAGASEDSGVIAQWSSIDVAGASWQMRFQQQPFCLALPPQGVGDEMVKAKEAKDPDAKTVKGTGPAPTGFNFSPPALLTVDPRVAKTNFSEAPWNLRRILGTPGQPGAGPGVLSMQLELLYGLSCNVDKPAVRLAEIFSRIGRIPGRRDPLMAWQGTKDQIDAYFSSRREWAMLYRRYLARVAVLEPWNNLLPTDTDTPPPLLNPSVTCSFRLPLTSNLANPVGAYDKTALRGGATWGFESPNVYNAVVKPTLPADLNSSSAELANIALSSEGGWGHVAAGFQGNLTRIIADVGMGRVARYQLERLGRIGVFWNLAKHVIVYERAVAPSRQFNGDQDSFLGWPLVRKVEEYVEILEEKRSYPDTSSGSTADAEATRRARGFVAHCSFGKENRFNVKSSWGADITNTTDRGWKVPLWQPFATPADIYPKRRPSLGVVGQAAGQPAIIPTDISAPQNLYFYTQTEVGGKDPDPDPHKWGAVLGIDYVNAPLPRPADPTEFGLGERRTFSADENVAPPAFTPCTFQLDRPSSAPDLMTERFGKPMTAFLDSVTMVRSIGGLIADPPAEWKAVAKVEGQVQAVYTKILSQIPLDEEKVSDSVKQAIKGLITDATFQNLKNAATDAQQAVNKVKNFDVGKYEADLRNKAIDRLNNALQSPLGELAEKVRAFTGDSADAAVAILERIRNTAAQQLLMIESLPGASAEVVLRYADGLRVLYTEVQAGIAAIDKLLQTGSSALADAANRADALYHRMLELYNALLAVGRQLPAAWMPDPTTLADAALGFTQLKQAMETFRSSLNGDLNAAKAALAQFKSDFVKYVSPDGLRDFIKVRLGIVIAGTGIPDIVDALRAKAWNIENIIKTWNKSVDDAVDAVRKAAPGTVAKVLSDQATNLANQLGASGFVQDAINKLVPVADSIKAIQGFLEGALGDTAGVLTSAQTRLNNLLNDGSIQLNELKARLEKERDALTNAARTYLDQAANSLMGSTALQVGDAGIRLIRAFGDPPRVPQLDFERTKLGYYFNQIVPNVDLSPVVSVVNQGAAVLDALKPLGLKLPTTQALDQLIPPDLRSFDVSKIFPNFAGLDLSHLFSGLKLPDSISKDNIKVTHGLDAQTQRAFVQTDIHFDLTDPATIFSAGPLTLSLPKGGFKATTLIAADRSGVTRKANGEMSGNWQLCIGGMVLLVLEQTKLTFDDSGGLHFSVDPHNIKMPGVLEFISKLLEKLTPKGSGLTVGLLPDGFQSVLKLPLPDVNFGAFGISNLSLGATFAIRYAGDFQLSLAANLARREAPFSLTIFILGGGGFFETEAAYRPSTGALTCSAEIGITVSASLAIALGPIKGGVYVYLGISAKFVSGQGGLTMGVMFLLRGEVSILSIVSASITLLLEATYGNGELIGHGRLTISIKICWCFTLDVNEEVTWHLAGGSSTQARSARPQEHVLLAALEYPQAPFLLAQAPKPQSPLSMPRHLATVTKQCQRAAHLYTYSLI